MNPWTDEITEYMIDLIADGHSFSEAAEAINGRYGTKFTRDAVAGRWARFLKKYYPNEPVTRYVTHNGRRVKIEIPAITSQEG